MRCVHTRRRAQATSHGARNSVNSVNSLSDLPTRSLARQASSCDLVFGLYQQTDLLCIIVHSPYLVSRTDLLLLVMHHCLQWMPTLLHARLYIHRDTMSSLSFLLSKNLNRYLIEKTGTVINICLSYWSSEKILVNLKKLFVQWGTAWLLCVDHTILCSCEAAVFFSEDTICV